MLSLTTRIIFALLSMVLTCGLAQGQTLPLSPLNVEKARGVVFLKHHGQFRFRTSFFSEQGLSGETIPLLRRNTDTGEEGSGASEASFFGSDLRFRYEPQLHISDNFILNLSADFLKDIRMGESPQSAIHDQPTAASNDSTGNYDSTRSHVFVTRLYGDWEPVSGLTLRLGRMPAHFGLGIEENSGDCEDCNGGTVVDGFDARANALGSNIRIAWWWPSEGAFNGDTSSQSGQPYDLSDLDDASEWLFELGPESSGDFARQEKREQAQSSQGWLFDWAARFKWRSADLQSDRFPKGAPCEGQAPGVDTPYDCMSLIPRNLSLWTPGLFLSLEGWPAQDKYLAFKLEVQAKLGSIGNILDTTPDPNSEEEISTSRDIQALGAAFEASFSQKSWTFKLQSALATGDPEGSYFGVRDGSNTIAPSGASLSETENYQRNQTFEQYIFHQDYFADVILFREAVGAVTNTILVRPSVSYTFAKGTNRYTIEGGVMPAWALAPKATPGKSRDLGLEADLKLKYTASENLNIVWTLAGLKPGAALAAEEGLDAPESLVSTQLDLFIRF